MVRRAHLVAAAVTVAAMVLALTVAPSVAADAEDRYRELDQLPTVATTVDDIAPTAVQLADQLDSVLIVDDGPRRKCPAERLQVSWEEPVGYEVGANISPIGPAPTSGTDQVNGVVVCERSTYSYFGFTATRGDDGWHLEGIPVFDEVGGHNLGPQPQDVDASHLDGLEVTGDLSDLGPIDPYAPYEPQRICDPTPKPGMVAMALLLLGTYEETENWGISRDCDLGGISEHKEGRAFDWGAHIEDTHQRVAVEDMLLNLLSSDSEGNRHALARRMGVMYIIWNGHIWSSFRADQGWRPYGGPSTHRDHVHVSLSWDGAMGQTSLWRVAVGPHVWEQLAPAANGLLPVQSILVTEDAYVEGGAPPPSPDDPASPTPSDPPSSDGPTIVPPTDGPTDEPSDGPLPTELPTLPLPSETPTLPLPSETPTLPLPSDPTTILPSPTLTAPLGLFWWTRFLF